MKELRKSRVWDSNGSYWVLNWTCLLEQIIWIYHHIPRTLCGENKCHRSTWAYPSSRLFIPFPRNSVHSSNRVLKDKLCLPQVNRLFHPQYIHHIWLCCHSAVWQKAVEDYNFPFAQSLNYEICGHQWHND